MEKRKLRVGLAYDSSDFYKKPGANEPEDKYYEFDSKRVINGIVRAFKQGGHKVVDLKNWENILNMGEELKDKVDIVFNIAEGLSGRNREAQVPIYLEYLGIPFVGSDATSMCLTLDKVMAKKVMIAEGVPTAKFITVMGTVSNEDIKQMKFPMIVKARWEGSSKSLTRKSKVNNLEELNEQVKRINELYGQPALVEEFIAGREFTVPVVGTGKEAKALEVLETYIQSRPAGDKFWRNEYINHGGSQYRHGVNITEAKMKKIAETAERVHRAMEARDFSRTDFRMDKEGNIFVLEINPLPYLWRFDAFGVVAKHLGITYEQMILAILETGVERNRKEGAIFPDYKSFQRTSIFLPVKTSSISSKGEVSAGSPL